MVRTQEAIRRLNYDFLRLEHLDYAEFGLLLAVPICIIGPKCRLVRRSIRTSSKTLCSFGRIVYRAYITFKILPQRKQEKGKKRARKEDSTWIEWQELEHSLCNFVAECEEKKGLYNRPHTYPSLPTTNPKLEISVMSGTPTFR